MKKNLYYRATDGRKNSIKDAIFSFFYSLSHYPRILLEVFIRKNFGERYFTLSAALVNFVVLFFVPLAIDSLHSMRSFGGRSSMGGTILTNITWYIFLAAYLYFSIQRRKEITTSKTMYDFTKYSLYDGDYDPRLKAIKINGKLVDNRQLEILIEPAAFLAIGIILTLCAQMVGILLIVSSIIYSLSYSWAYRHGDNFVLDKIDEMISIKQFHKSFVEGIDTDYKVRGNRPVDPEYRNDIANECIVDDDFENQTYAV